jgi:hypothetical protein
MSPLVACMILVVVALGAGWVGLCIPRIIA